MASQDTRELTVDWVTLLRTVLKNWWKALLVGLTFAMLAFVAVTGFYRYQYASGATLAVAYTESNGSVYSDLSSTNSLAETFSQMLNSSVMKSKVAEALGQKTFTGTISVEIVEETNLLTMTVKANTPQLAWEGARAVLAVYPQITESIMSNVVVSVLQTPAFPETPCNAVSMVKVLALAMLLGVALVFGITAVFSDLQDTVKNEAVFSRCVDGRLLVTIGAEQRYKTPAAFLQRKKTSILISKPTTGFLFTETYKVLRAKVAYTMQRKGLKTLLITSVTENEGKSTVSANLALALAESGYRVILVDGDMHRPALYKVFDMTVPNTNPLYSVATGAMTAAEVKLGEAEYGLQLLLGRRSCPNSSNVITSDDMRRMIATLREQADFVVIDTPPISMVTDAENLAGMVDASLMVVRQDLARIRDVNDAADALRESGSEFLGCVFNNVHTSVLMNRISGNFSDSGYGYKHYGRADSGK